MPANGQNFTISESDASFRRRFESCEFAAGQFHHRDHIRLAYIYLTEGSSAAAAEKMRSALRSFLHHHQVDPTKFHETMTRAWILAVAHFMTTSRATDSADEFIEANTRLLDVDIMLSHYSHDRLFSEQARQQFLAPDREPIP